AEDAIAAQVLDAELLLGRPPAADIDLFLTEHAVSSLLSASHSVIKPCPYFLSSKGASDDLMLCEEFPERRHKEQHVEVAAGRLLLQQMHLLNEVDESHVDERSGYRVLDLFDVLQGLIAVDQGSGLVHVYLQSVERGQGTDIGPETIGCDVNATPDG